MSKQPNKNQNKAKNQNGTPSGQVFYQRNQATGEVREFEIFNEKYLKITTQRLMQESSFQFNVGLLEPWPSRHRQISWFWLSASIYFALATVAYISYLMVNMTDQLQLLSQLLPLVVIFILLTLAALVLFFLKSPNVMQFRSRYGGCVLVSVFYNRPDAKKFDTFVELLKNRILATSQNMNMDKRRMLLIEMQELKRLGNEGILTTTDIKQAQMRFAQLNFA